MASNGTDSGIITISDKIYDNILPFKQYTHFNFRNKPNSKRLGIFPHCDIGLDNLVKNDISFKTFDNMKMNDLFEYIPGVQLREYIHDSRFVQVQNMFTAFAEGYKDIKKASEKTDFVGILKNVFDELTSDTTLEKIFNGIKPSSMYSTIPDSKEAKFTIDIPFILYYLLMTFKTKAVYTVPYSGKIVESSNGQSGWDTKHGIAGLQTSQNSIFGTLLNYMGKNIRINTTPVWGGDEGSAFPEISIEFDLFNDSHEQAINNFLFIHNIVPKNKFLQYHLYQHNPAVYDVKIEGFNRFYMCSANIQCEAKGVIRDPSYDFIKDIKSKYTNGDYKSNITDLNVIKIPDVYSVKITCKSLLPNSLNNYLYSYTANLDMQGVEWVGDYSPKDSYGEKIGNKIEKEATAIFNKHNK